MLLFLLHDERDTVTSITQSTEEGEENSTHTRYTCGEVTELVSGNNVVRYAYDGKRRVTQVYLNDLGNAYLRNTFTDDTTLSGVTGKVDKCVSTNAKNESVTSYTDKQGKLCQVTLSSGKEVKYTYNTKGEVTSVVDGVSGLTETYGYDSFDRVKNYARGSEYTEGYEYDAYGSVSSVTLGGGVSRTYTYAYKSNAARELESITSDGYKYVPQTDKLGRNAGREVVSGTTKIAGEYIYYRKVGDHATNILKYAEKLNDSDNKFSDEARKPEVVHYVDRDIINTYYNPTQFGTIYKLKPEFDKRKCVKNAVTGQWHYVEEE